ncbi:MULTISPECIES: hypothetical protein [unclassified Myroides]|uniref:hypothetical protein n=1 Tax=unclassified Myroides TaxID=2642485 RepID=UPI002574AB17|nr:MULTISPECIES: hypothetical protein [unclassified Myroides]MDM1044420.1 hypothetical protein [Myroides sp. R163-1]
MRPIAIGPLRILSFQQPTNNQRTTTNAQQPTHNNQQPTNNKQQTKKPSLKRNGFLTIEYLL